MHREYIERGYIASCTVASSCDSMYMVEDGDGMTYQGITRTRHGLRGQEGIYFPVMAYVV
jgi:hypothetical protein